MSRVRVVTDSTSDLPQELCEQLGIAMVPLYVMFGDESYKDRQDITAAGFYEKMASAAVLPHTSQPSPADFLEVYQASSEPGDDIVSIHVSAKLSGTIQSANLAKSMLHDRRVLVVDSFSVSQGLGLAVVAAAEAANAGKSAAEVAEIAAAVSAQLGMVYSVDSLDHLQRTGRIGKAAALVGGLLAVRPLLTIEDGLVAPLDKVRGKARVLPRMLEIMQERTPAGRAVIVALVHGGAPAEAEELEARVRSLYHVRRLLHGWVGPVIGANAGPKILGLIWYEVT